MKKRILIVHSNMCIGGAESSLLGLLQSMDYDKYDVTLMLFEKTGELLALVDRRVKIISAPPCYRALTVPIVKAAASGRPFIAAVRIAAKIKALRYSDKTYITKQTAHRLSMPFMKKIDGSYDLAISFIDPHYLVAKKVDAKRKLAWLHTDFSRIQIDRKTDLAMWSCFDGIVSVSQACKDMFDRAHPSLSEKSIVIENILSRDFILSRAREPISDMEKQKGETVLLSVGRFSSAKNFDNVPDICRRLVEGGLNVKWYLIGYGSDEQLIKSKIEQEKMSGRVIILGKRENPYPYIAKCDVYVQPSRYEGKSVCVREAQLLGRPVIITDYATASNQLENGVDGLIVPMDNEGCALALAAAIKNEPLLRSLSRAAEKRDYTNRAEIEKIYEIAEE